MTKSNTYKTELEKNNRVNYRLTLFKNGGQSAEIIRLIVPSQKELKSWIQDNDEPKFIYDIICNKLQIK